MNKFGIHTFEFFLRHWNKRVFEVKSCVRNYDKVCNATQKQCTEMKYNKNCGKMQWNLNPNSRIWWTCKSKCTIYNLWHSLLYTQGMPYFLLFPARNTLDRTGQDITNIKQRYLMVSHTHFVKASKTNCILTTSETDTLQL